MVEWKAIGELGTFYGGLTGKSKNDFTDGNAKFVSYMNVYNHPKLNDNITDTVKVSANEKQNKIQCGDILFTGSSETPDECGMSSVVCRLLEEDIYLNSFCFGFRWNNSFHYSPEFMSHLFRSELMRSQIYKTANGVTRFNVSKKQFAKISIPILPLSEQQRIVNALDTFTSSIDNLKEQTAQRRKQYEHYRDQLLDFKDRIDVQAEKLGALCNVLRGKRLTKKELTDTGKYPVFHGGVLPIGYYNEYNREGDMVMIINVGASAGTVSYYKNEFWSSDGCFCIEKSSIINNRYLFYYLQSRTRDIQNKVRHAGIPTLDASAVANIIISIPSLSEQSRIVSILDSFEASIANLEEQLALRQKQYEYYREKLLTFE